MDRFKTGIVTQERSWAVVSFLILNRHSGTCSECAEDEAGTSIDRWGISVDSGVGGMSV